MKQQHTLQPKLRFSEFKQKAVIKRAGDIFINYSNKNHDGKLEVLAITQDRGAVPRSLINYDVQVTEEGVSNYKIVEKGNFIISLRSFQGGIEYSDYDGICSPAYIILKSKEEIIDNYFKYYLKTYNYINQLKRTLEGIRDGKMIPYRYFSDTILTIPSLPEQQKIADYLSTIDTKINLLEEKKAQLALYKKAMMQKLFTQEIRFKDDNGNDFLEWEEKILKEVSLDYYQGINTTADKLNYFLRGYPILQAKHITNEIIDFTDVKFVNEEDFNRYKTKYQPKVNDILFTNIGTIGKSLICTNNNFLIAWNIFKITVETSLIMPLFMLFYLRYYNSIGIFKSLETGNATKFINKEDLLNLKIMLPSLPEQQKIANFLSAINESIEKVNEQITQMQSFKKAMLQQMFV